MHVAFDENMWNTEHDDAIIKVLELLMHHGCDIQLGTEWPMPLGRFSFSANRFHRRSNSGV